MHCLDLHSVVICMLFLIHACTRMNLMCMIFAFCTSGIWGSTHECKNVLNVEFPNAHRWG